MSSWAGKTPGISQFVQKTSVSQIALTVLIVLVGRWVIKGIRRVYFHPLSRFPGPKFCAFTRFSQLKATFEGSTHIWVKGLHEEYGGIVRIAPDELSFIHPDAWRDIYGHGTKGTRGSVPPKHWLRYGSPANNVQALIGESRNGDHARMRRIFNPAFADRALKQQEPLFMKYVDQLVDLLKRNIEEDAEGTVDLVRMYNFTTFDVMGDLTYGESLHMLDKSEYDPWVSIIFGSVKIGNRLSFLYHYPFLYRLFKRYAPKSTNRKRAEHWKYSVDRVTKRLEKGRASEGVDLWDLVLGQKEGKGLSRDEMDSNSSLFMIAGTETTATLVSGLTYLLLKNPETMNKLVAEVRTAFATSAMSMEAIAALPYLNACIKEALRMYPPVTTGLSHLTPPDGSTICGEYVPPGFIVAAPHYAMYMSEMLFKEPLSFIPERWLGDERFANDQRAAVQPFSVGSRDCLGKNMAYHEMRLIMAKVLFNFDLELCPESDGWMDQEAHILWQKHPLMVRLTAVDAS